MRAAARWGKAHGDYSPEHRVARRLDRRTSPELPMATCAIDMANEGPLTLEQVGEQMGLTRERARQIEDQALRKMLRVEFDGHGAPETPLGGLTWRIGRGE